MNRPNQTMQGLSLTYNIFLGPIIGYGIILHDLALRQTNLKGSIQLSFREGLFKSKTKLCNTRIINT